MMLGLGLQNIAAQKTGGAVHHFDRGLVDLDGVTNWSGNGDLRIVPQHEGMRNVLRGQPSTGHDIYSRIYPFNPARSYRVKTRLHVGAGIDTPRFYVGIRAKDTNGTDITHNPGSYAYVALSGESFAPNTGWFEAISDVIVPEAPPYTAYGYPLGTAFVSLVLLANYNAVDCEWGCDHITLLDVTDPDHPFEVQPAIMTPRPNLCLNPSGENDLSGWLSDYTMAHWSVSGGEVSAFGNGAWRNIYRPIAYTGGAITCSMDVYRSSDSDGIFRAGIFAYKSNPDEFLGLWNFSFVAADAQWRRYSVTIPEHALANASTIYPLVEFNSSQGGVAFKRVKVEQGLYATPFVS